jgi:aspartate-semialdehyde dehydrogenase
MDILDNVVPHIGGEEEKIETEPRKMLGRLGGTAPSSTKRRSP